MNIVGSAFVTVLDGIVFAVIIFRQTNAPAYIGIPFVITFFQGVLEIERILAAVVALGGGGVSFRILGHCFNGRFGTASGVVINIPVIAKRALIVTVLEIVHQ